jgi:hypothetical protein
MELIRRIKPVSQQMNTAIKLARELFADDLSRHVDMPVVANGYRALGDWTRAAAEAGDNDMEEALKALTESEERAFVLEWHRLYAETFMSDAWG